MRSRSPCARAPLAALAVLAGALCLGSAAGQGHGGLDAGARRWVDDTLARLTPEQKIAQLVVPSFRAIYTSSDSESYRELEALVREQQVGGLLMFGARTPQPAVLLNPNYSRTGLGEPLNAASLIQPPAGGGAGAAARHGPTSRRASASGWRAPRSFRTPWRSARRGTRAWRMQRAASPPPRPGR